ncbi:MAG: hypothetical protein NVS3B16_08790 [Vulcanimicrobiaceae bacterium]
MRGRFTFARLTFTHCKTPRLLPTSRTQITFGDHVERWLVTVERRVGVRAEALLPAHVEKALATRATGAKTVASAGSYRSASRGTEIEETLPRARLASKRPTQGRNPFT